MIELKLIETLYNQLQVHSNNWSEDLSGVNILIQETHKISGIPRADIVALLQVLEGLELLKVKSEQPLTYEVKKFSPKELKLKISNGCTAPYRIKNLLQIFDLIERRPEMFFGIPSFEYFHMFITGYIFAAQSHKDDFQHLNILTEFTEYLYEHFDDSYGKYYASWHTIIAREFDSKENGLKMFFEYMWKFRLVRNYS